MFRVRRTIALIASLTLVGACSSNSSSSATTGASTSATTVTTAPPTTVHDTTAPSTAVPSTTVPPTTVRPTTVPPTTVPDTTSPVEVQLAVWPASDVVFTTPEAASADFLAAVFGVGPVLGEFMAGDSRSGEIEVFASVDGAPIGDARSVLLLRQLGPDDGWFVLAAASEKATITTPEPMATVPAGALAIAGVGSGFEATIVLSAFVAGDAATEFDREVTMVGNFGDVLPYSISLDLTAATTGDVVVLLNRGGTGLETDPGDFSAVPVLIA